ncbi:MAG: hypothetical protein ACREDR_25880 [Blastocatellia bacterium]
MSGPSRYALEVCVTYAQWRKERLKDIDRPEGFGAAIRESGSHDDRIEVFLALVEAAKAARQATVDAEAKHKREMGILFDNYNQVLADEGYAELALARERVARARERAWWGVGWWTAFIGVLTALWLGGTAALVMRLASEAERAGRPEATAPAPKAIRHGGGVGNGQTRPTGSAPVSEPRSQKDVRNSRRGSRR